MTLKPTPSTLADFKILRRLGAGGMAEVFLAKKGGAEGTFKLLVVKRVLPSHGTSRRFRKMFVDEAHLATRLNHPNIVQVYEFSDHGDDGLLLSMEYVEGFDLGKVMGAAKHKGARIPPYVAAFIIAETAKGLHYAHERRDEGGVPLAIVHRDVSPQNILLSYDSGVKIADFGIASANLFREEVGVLKGKFGYMSPEQARGEKVDRRSDLYALGVVLYELLTLRSPYGKLDDDALLEAVRTGDFAPPSKWEPDVPPELEAIVLRAMSLAPSDRFQTARDMAGSIARTLLAKQELVDSASVEATLVHLLGREQQLATIPPSLEAEAQPRTLAAMPHARTSGDAGDSNVAPSPRVVREVRHVEVVTLRLTGIEGLELALGRAGARRAQESVRSILGDIAYKHGAVWSWSSDTQARAIVGLMENPSRAAAEAASLAIDVHEALDGASEDLPATLRAALGIVRGVATGERNEQGHLVRHVLQNPASFLADRLAAATPYGTTWVAGGVYRLVRRDFHWGDAPSLGLADAGDQPLPSRMRIYELQRPLSQEERVAESALAPSDLVGRDSEKADLHAAYHRAVAQVNQAISPPPSRFAGQPGEPRHPTTRPPAPGASIDSAPASRPPRGALTARVIVGEMGIGKTALVSTFLSEIPGDARVVHVECSPVTSELPFATVCDLLRDITGMGLEQTIEEATEALRDLFGSTLRGARANDVMARLAELVAGKQLDHADEDGPTTRRDLVMVGLRGLFGALARARPLVVVIDGLQWADRDSLEILEEMLRRTEAQPILVVLMTRPEERVAPHVEGLVRIELRGLSADDQVRLVEARLGVRDGVAAVCAELVPRVAGNPFFLLEMIEALLERGALEIIELPGGRHELQQRDHGESAEALPSTLDQLIGDRLRELPAEEHDVVDWLAVAGGPLFEGDLLALTRLADDEAITRLCARGLCDRRAGSLDFRHPLVRDVAYFAMDVNQRSRLHRRLGEHLATTPLAHGLSAAIVARHLARGEAPEPAAALYLEAAAAARGAHLGPLARRYYLRALSLLPANDSRRMDAHEALEAVHRVLGQRRERREHLTALRKLARESGQAHAVALALARTARCHLDDGHLAKALPIAQRAAEIARMAQQNALEVEAQTLLSEVLRELGDLPGALAACERALEVAQTGNLPARARADVLRAKGVLLRVIGKPDEAVEAYVEAIAVFRAVGARRLEARAKNALAYAMFVLERFEDAIALALGSVRIDLSIGGRFQIAKTLSNVGQAYARLGDLKRGLAYLARAREAHERYADQDSRADTLLCSAEALLEAGDSDAAHTLWADASALVAVTGSVYDGVHERIIAAVLARARGDARAAVEFAATARRSAETQALASFHLYATAIEAAARADAGDLYTAMLLARTAFGAVEASAGCEYGIEIRSLACHALRKGTPAAAREAAQRAAAHVEKVAGHVRAKRLRELLLGRSVVLAILAGDDGRASAPSSHRPTREPVGQSGKQE